LGPDLDYVSRKGDFVSNLLNSLRIEKYFLKSRVNEVTIKACGVDLCTSGTFNLVTYNTNRGPVFEDISTFYVNETQELKLDVQAVDPDGDIVKYYYPEPFTRRGGSWKTTFNDEGNYTYYVSASDGEIERTHPINVVVEKRNRNPTIKVSDTKVLVNEGEEFTLFVEGSDPDSDDIDITLDFLPYGAEFRDGVFVWTPNFMNVENKSKSIKNKLVNDHDYLNRRFNSDSEVYWLTFSADDGEGMVKQPVKVIVKNRNRKPDLIDVIPEKVIAKVNEPVVFQVIAKDKDNDKLEYKWNFGIGETSIGGTNVIERTFVAPGDKKVEVTIDDGTKAITKIWDVQIVNEQYSLPSQPLNFGNVKVYVIDI